MTEVGESGSRSWERTILWTMVLLLFVLLMSWTPYTVAERRLSYAAAVRLCISSWATCPCVCRFDELSGFTSAIMTDNQIPKVR